MAILAILHWYPLTSDQGSVLHTSLSGSEPKEADSYSLHQPTSLALWLLVGLATGDTSKKSGDGQKEQPGYMVLEWRFKPVMAKEKGDDMTTKPLRRKRGQREEIPDSCVWVDI